jgi:hypothetical protein
VDDPPSTTAGATASKIPKVNNKRNGLYKIKKNIRENKSHLELLVAFYFDGPHSLFASQQQ